MLFPSMCIDNFFQNPDEVVRYAKQCKYYPSETGEWPGKRTKRLHLISPELHRHFGRKVLATLFPNNYENITYNMANVCFQKISPEYINKGWIHVDGPADLTVIVYLSKHKKCGTSIFQYKNAFPTPTEELMQVKKKTYKEKSFEQETETLKKNNNDFEETISFNSCYNRAIFFDGSQWHGEKQFVEKNIKEDRLTLIGFYYGINSTKFHVTENNRL